MYRSILVARIVGSLQVCLDVCGYQGFCIGRKSEKIEMEEFEIRRGWIC